MQTAISKNMVHNHFQLVVVIDLAKKFSEYCLLGCNDIYSGREVPAFLMKVPVHCWCRTTRNHIPGANNLNNHCHENLGSHEMFSADVGSHPNTPSQLILTSDMQ
jgi:hypothetical protein